jgi:glucosamine-6-phosphate deaminase
MQISISKNVEELGKNAAKFVSEKLNQAINANGEARLVVSTGSSQFELFAALTRENVDWGKIKVFHLFLDQNSASGIITF